MEILIQEAIPRLHVSELGVKSNLSTLIKRSKTNGRDHTNEELYSRVTEISLSLRVPVFFQKVYLSRSSTRSSERNFRHLDTVDIVQVE